MAENDESILDDLVLTGKQPGGLSARSVGKRRVYTLDT